MTTISKLSLNTNSKTKKKHRRWAARVAQNKRIPNIEINLNYIAYNFYYSSNAVGSQGVQGTSRHVQAQHDLKRRLKRALDSVEWLMY